MLKEKIGLCGLTCLILLQASCTTKDYSLIVTGETMGSEQNLAGGLSPSEVPCLVAPEEELSPEEAPELVCVHVCGAVHQSGVYYLPQGSRVNDALLAAGGLTEEGDTDYMNLALPVSDGEQVYFPTKEEATLLNRADGTIQSGMVNINTADVAGLCSLPGIGESRAKDIIAYRRKNGRFEKTEDIMKVPGIKQSIFDRINDCITVE